MKDNNAAEEIYRIVEGIETTQQLENTYAALKNKACEHMLSMINKISDDLYHGKTYTNEEELDIIKGISTLVRSGADLDIKSKNGETLLMLMAVSNSPRVVEVLLDMGADIKIHSDDGWTALMIAKHYKCDDIIEILQNKALNDSLLEVAEYFEEGVENELIGEVQNLLNQGADINARDSEGLTLLMLAVKQGRLEMLQFLIEQESDINAESDENETALMFSSIFNNAEATDILLKAGADVFIRDNEGFSALEIAKSDGYEDIIQMISEREYEVDKLNYLLISSLMKFDESGEKDTFIKYIQRLVDKGAHLDAKNDAGYSALTLAARYCSVDVVQCLIDLGAWREEDYEPFLVAVYSGREEIVRRFVELDSNIINVARDPKEYTALMLAAQEGHLEVVNFLKDRVSDINFCKDEGVKALMIAVENGHLEIVKTLIDAGVDINFCKEDGVTALMIAAEYGHATIVQSLIDEGADVNISNDENSTALLFAAQSGHFDVLNILKDKVIDIDICNNGGYTALIVSAARGHEEVVQSLIASGANINIVDADSYTALTFAAKAGHSGVVDILIEAGLDITSLHESDAILNRKEAAECLINQLNKIIKDYDPESKSDFTNVVTMFERFLTDNVEYADNDIYEDEEENIKNCRFFPEIYKTVSSIIGPLSHNPSHIEWFEEVADISLDECVNQPVTGVTKLLAIMLIVEAETMADKISEARHTMVLREITMFIKKLPPEDKVLPNSRLPFDKIEAEIFNVLNKHIQERLFAEGVTKEIGPGVQERITYASIVSEWVSGRVDRAYEGAKALATVSNEEVVEFLCLSEFSKIWAKIIAPNEMLEIDNYYEYQKSPIIDIAKIAEGETDPNFDELLERADESSKEKLNEYIADYRDPDKGINYLYNIVFKLGLEREKTVDNKLLELTKAGLRPLDLDERSASEPEVENSPTSVIKGSEVTKALSPPSLDRS